MAHQKHTPSNTALLESADYVGCVSVRTKRVNAQAIDRFGIAQAKTVLNQKKDADLHAASRQFSWII